jgi:hypothetical protein
MFTCRHVKALHSLLETMLLGCRTGSDKVGITFITSLEAVTFIGEFHLNPQTLESLNP